MGKKKDRDRNQIVTGNIVGRDLIVNGGHVTDTDEDE